MDFRRPLTVVTPTLDGDVLSVLAGADEEFSGRRLHRMVSNGSENGVRNAAERLVAQGVVSSRRAGRANLYRLNRDHLAAPHIEGLATLRAQLFERLRKAIASWQAPPRWAMVFGSVARGEAGPLSDLDLLVVRSREDGEDDPGWRAQLDLLEELAAAWTGNEAQILEYSEDELGDAAVVSVLERALAEGIELHGSRRSLRLLIEKGGVQ